MNYTRGCYRQPNVSDRMAAKNYANAKNMSACVRGSRYNECRYNNNEDINYKLGMVYSPYQEWQNLYPCDKGFSEGTIFIELNKPFEGYKCNKGGSCLL